MTTTALSPDTVTECPPFAFTAALNLAMSASERINDYLSHGLDYSQNFCYLSADGQSGFAITKDGELISVFSLVRGRGAILAKRAADFGATLLDCFDGYLPGFYASQGWVEYDRSPNWTPGGPDVVFMTR